MSNYIYTMFFIGVIGLFTGWIGIYIGIFSSSFIKDRGRKFKGFMLGILGGLTLGIVCFDLLPEAFEAGSVYIVITGIAIGLILSVFLDGKLDFIDKTVSKNKENNFLKVAIFMIIGIGIHNLPSGVALGSLIYNSPINGFRLILALVIHGIPEGLTLGVFLRECNANKIKLLLVSVLTAIPMGIGAALGCILRAPIVICLSLSFASSMILYVTLRETLPAANYIWKGRLTTIGNVLGIILGMILISLFHK